MRPEFGLRAIQQREDFLLVLLALCRGQLGAKEIHVRDKADRHALWEWTDLHGISGAGNKRKQPPSHVDERPEVIGNVPFRQVKIAVDGDAIDYADTGTVLVGKQCVLIALLGP